LISDSLSFYTDLMSLKIGVGNRMTLVDKA
jgi:hypothetical protein